MAFGLTPIQLIVLSGLLQDKGLRIPPALTNRIDKLKDTKTIFGRLSYIAWHPQSNANMTSVKNAIRTITGLAGVIPSTYTAPLPEAISMFDVVGSIRSRADNLLSNGLKGVLDNLVISSGALQNSFNVQASLDTYKNSKFSDLYLNATNYTDVLSHGLTSTFGSSANGTPAQQKAATAKQTVTTADIRRNLESLAKGIENMGNLYDWTDLNTVGTPHGFIKNIYKIGAAYNTEINNLMSTYGYNVETITASDSIGLTQLLQRIIGKDIATILKASKAVPPDIKQIDTAADFLSATKVLPFNVADMLPNKDLSQLGKKLTSLGVDNADIKAILTALTTVKIIDLPHLRELTQPVPKADAAVVQSALVTGNGKFNNATLDDILGSLTGNYYFDYLDAIIKSNVLFSKADSGGTALMTAANSIMTTLIANGTVSESQATAFTSAVTAFKTSLTTSKANYNKQLAAKAAASTLDQVWPTYRDAENAVLGIITQLKTEIVNGEIIDIRINSNLQVTTANTTIDSFDIRNIRKAVYSISVQNNDKIDDFETKVIHNGSIANLTVYNRVTLGTATSLGNIYATVNVAANTCTVSYATASDNNYHTFLRSIAEYATIGDGSNPTALQSSSAELNTIYQLDEIAADTKFTGIGALLESMATNDVYGEAILASLETSRNTKKLEAIGINGQRADPVERLTELLAKQGHGLTESQRRQIITASKADGTDPNLAISNASRHGFFSDYYSKKGNFG